MFVYFIFYVILPLFSNFTSGIMQYIHIRMFIAAASMYVIANIKNNINIQPQVLDE